MDAKILIKKYEGCKLEAYMCPAGVWTIGYGHTKGVKQGDKITQLMAEQLFEQDYKEAEDQVKQVVQVPLTVNQLGALTSFVFNLGIARLTGSTLLKKLNDGDYIGAADEFDKWVYSKGKKLAGLIERRAKEKELFLTK